MNTTTSPENKALAVAAEPRAVAMGSPGNAALMLEPKHLENMLAVAELMASGVATVPQHLRKNKGDCLAVIMQAVQWGMNPFAVAQKTHLVNGTLGYEAQLVSAVINTSRLLATRLDFEWFGNWEKIVGKFKEVESRTKKDDNGHPKKYIVPAWEQKDEHGLGVRVWATIKGESKPRILELLMTQARTRNSTLWTEDPKQQLAYLAEKRWGRLHSPDVLLGVYTPDELDGGYAEPQDMGEVQQVAEVDALVLELKKTTTDADALAFWNAHKAKLSGNKVAYDHFKDQAALHRKALAEARTVDAATTVVDKASVKTDAPEVTFDMVLRKINDAKNEDGLNVAADWINALSKPEEVNSLNARYDERLAEMRGAA